MKATMKILVLIAAVLFLACGKDAADQRTKPRSMTVYCGSANKPAMEVIAQNFQRETGVVVNLIFGGSGTLLAQLEFSKQGEIYLPGSPDYIIIGNRKKLLVEGSDRIVAYLLPGIITPAGNPAGIRSIEDLTRDGIRVGIGNPKSVCLGLYSIELLETLKLTDRVLENVVTFGGSCSKTANLAALGQVDAILGWRVFHHWNPARMAYVPIDPKKIPRISYIPISVPKVTRDRALSERFIEYVLSDRGREVYERFGYMTDRQRALQLAPGATIGGEYELPSDYFDRVKRLADK